jgi:RecJ-like exonuclease
MTRCMKILFKTKVAEIIVTAKTNRKTCLCCNGSGQMQTDEGKDECDYCGGSGDFMTMIENNHYITTKYFSEDDIQKMEMIRKIHEFTFYRDVYTYDSLSELQASKTPYPKEEDLIVRRIQ